jgi:hypothetical protein
LKKLGYENPYIEDYLNDNFTIPKDKYNLFMSSIYYNLHEYKDSLKFAELCPNLNGIKIKIMCFYNLKEYSSCLEAIMENYCALDNYYMIVAFCCMLLHEESQRLYYSELLTRLKKDNLFSILDAYNFFAFESAYYGDICIVENFCSILILSSNIKSVKYIRLAMNKLTDLKYEELATLAFSNDFFYLCDEILNLYYTEIKNNYNLLLLKAKVLFKLGNISECEKYLECALTLHDSNELHKLRCLCKITECIDIINSCPDNVKNNTINNVLGCLEDARNLLT